MKRNNGFRSAYLYGMEREMVVRLKSVPSHSIPLPADLALSNLQSSKEGEEGIGLQLSEALFMYTLSAAAAVGFASRI
ncbi:unnamed protein product [Dovyalis caffra]|uniref:Uncharacterized protein n=1 Tax=Dovyalis caffra TaxID=77055 RepID=A0AAV1SJ58_9ROSI|nr:unnamed protein product [Dovyalis caffra]